jgi:DNA (cytosine-5)-methyltransferase 1
MNCVYAHLSCDAREKNTRNRRTHGWRNFRNSQKMGNLSHYLTFFWQVSRHIPIIVPYGRYLVQMSVTFIDLFAGIGGFHAAGESFGWDCVFANEIDPAAAAVYEENWNLNALGNIHDHTRANRKKPIPSHDVLFAGFPCQPFSKSGKQRGMDEDRGSLFHDIAFILEKHKPSMVVLENVRNIAGPRHAHEWLYIIQKLRDLGYRVSGKPFVVSPHRIPPKYGGTPQARERVFIVGTRLPSKRHALINDDTPLQFPTDFDGWDTNKWNLFSDLPLDESQENFIRYRLKNDEIEILNAWDDLIKKMLIQREGIRLPGFPLWSDIWGSKPIYEKVENAPEWKKEFESKNRQFYLEHKKLIDEWFKEFPIVRASIPSKRKLEWQAQDMTSIWNGLIHFRPSGIRVKRPTYVPALVAITQTTIIGKLKRRISPKEAARLQGMPETFSFGSQSDVLSYKQLGNGVSVGAVYQVVRAAIQRDAEILKVTNPKLLRSVKKSLHHPNAEKNSKVESKVAKIS